MVRFEHVDVHDLAEWFLFYDVKPNTFREIRVHDDMQFSDYRDRVMEMMKDESVNQMRVVWNLLDLTRLPYEHFYPQIRLMSELRTIIWTKIEESCIVVRNDVGLVNFLRFLFSIYTPQRPVTVLVVKGDVTKMLNGTIIEMMSKHASSGAIDLWF